ncbi:MAG TPA: GNAT family N-acetyltransferase [Candidatus Bathyarchaeia archaeon]
MRLTTLDQDIDAGRKYLNERSLQIGHVLPLSQEIFKEYFPERNSFLLYSVRAVDALFSFHSGREKWTPRADFVIVTDSLAGLKEAVGRVEDTALAQEKLVLRTRIFGYDRKRLQALKTLNYKIGATIPGAASLDGKRFDLHYLYKELGDRYRFNISRSYAKPGLYPILEVDKAKNQRLKLRGYRKEDRSFLNKAATHLNVIRGIAGGVFEGSVPWSPGTYEEWFDKRRVFPIVCEDESIGEPVGLLDLSRVDPDVMQHVMILGMYVRAEYQGLGVGTLLIDAMKILAKRLSLSRVILTVFEGNIPAEKLYAKAGFVECGKLPGWLQEGYINEMYMTLQLDQ